jgi:hypothetical protein
VKAPLGVLLCLLLAACTSAAGPPAAVLPSDSPAVPGQFASGPRITPPPVTPPTPPGTNLPAFACADTAGGTVGVANVTDVRVATQSSFDRFVLQFDTTVPAYTVKRQAKPVFIARTSGQSITLSGIAGVAVQVHSASETNTYAGSVDFTESDFPIMKEARLIEDFGGYVTWGLGLTSAACLRSFTLTDPARLVVDFTTAPG